VSGGCTMIQICHGYHGDSGPMISNFFFGVAGYKGEIHHNDAVILAMNGHQIVGGAFVHDQGSKKTIFIHAKDKEVSEKLSAEILEAKS